MMERPEGRKIMSHFWFQSIDRPRHWQWSLARTYRVISSASVDLIWQKIVDLADVSWHPLLTSTNAPYGLVVKPGLIYKAVMRLVPFPIRIFVERVGPGEFLSIRIIAIPGVEERVTYQIESSMCGTCISYSVMLRGWLSPLFWSLTRKYAARVADLLAQAAESESDQPGSNQVPSVKNTGFDF